MVLEVALAIGVYMQQSQRFICFGGDDGTRTHDFHVANVALSQLSYIPENRTRQAFGKDFAELAPGPLAVRREAFYTRAPA